MNTPTEGNKYSIKYLIKRPIYKYAANLILLGFLLLGGWFYQNSNTQYEKIYQTYYTSYQSMYITRSNNSISLNLSTAFLDYDQENYDKSLNIFEQFITQDTMLSMVKFYRGICQMEIEDFPGAIKSFDELIRYKNPFYLEPSHWYIALSYLRLENKKESSKHFQWLIDNHSRYYGPNAQKILQELK